MYKFKVVKKQIVVVVLSDVALIADRKKLKRTQKVSIIQPSKGKKLVCFVSYYC